MSPSLPQLLAAPARATVTPARDVLSRTEATDHGQAFAEALAQARGKAEDHRRPEAPAREDRAGRPTGLPVVEHAKHTTPKVEHTDEPAADEEPVEGEPVAQVAPDARAVEHAAPQALASQGIPFRDAQAPAEAVTTPAPVDGVEVAPSVTGGAAPAPSVAAAASAAPAAEAAAPAASAEATDDPTALPTGEGSATDLSTPVDGRTAAPTATTTDGPAPVVDGPTSASAAAPAEQVPADSTGDAQATPATPDAEAPATSAPTADLAGQQGADPGTDTGTGSEQGHRQEHGDHGRHLGRADDATATPLAVGRDLGAAGGQHLGRTAGPRTDAPEQVASAPTVTGLAATPSAQATTATSASGTTPAAAPVAVPDQVFASLSRLVRRGDGTHRLTIKLQPEALGEVRVVLTVRDGDVSVRLSGSDAAQRALLQGASDLQRLLESVGAKSAQVVVGDQSQGSASWAGQAGQSGTGRQGPDRPASYDRPEHTAPDPTLTRARTRQSVLDVTV